MEELLINRVDLGMTTKRFKLETLPFKKKPILNLHD